MNRLFILGGGAVVCGIIIIPLILSFTLPSRVEALLVNGLREAGFEKVQTAATEKKHGAVILKDIKLGEDGFSSIKEVRAEYNWTGLLFSQRLRNLNISGMNLTGELNRYNSITLAGWTQPTGILKKSLAHSNSITIEKANIDLMSETVGGINLKLDGQIRRKSKGGLAIQGHIEGAQRQLSVGAKLTGDIGKDGNWQANLEIEQGKLDIGQLRAGRISGLAQVFGQGIAVAQTSTQLSAGAVTLYGLPWQNASATIEGEPGSFTVFLEGKSIGEEGIEFGINFNYADGIKNLEGTVHTEKLPELFAYLQEHKAIPADINPPAMLAALPGLSLSFGQSESQENAHSYLYTLQDGSQIVDLKGILEIDPETKTASATLSASPVLLEKVLQQQEKKPQNGFSGGVMSVSGNFESARKDEKLQIKGKALARLEDARYFIGPLSFENIKGDIVFDDLKSWSSSESNLNFKLPLQTGIEQKGKTKLKIRDGKTFALNDTALDIFGGKITADPIILSKDLSEQNMSLLVSGVDMGRVVQALDIEGLHISGLAAGNLPLSYTNGTLAIKGGSLYSAQGNIRYRPKTPPQFLKGDDMYVETMRLALEDYRFTNLDVKINGPLNGELKLTIVAQGSNPGLFEGRPVELNFGLTVKPSELISKIVKIP